VSERRNINRGYMRLTVWQDASDYYVASCQIFRALPYDLKRVSSQQIASVDSIHRNIVEGYCRRTIREYLQYLNIALASAGESVSGLRVCLKADQIDGEQFEPLDQMAFKLENGLIKLIESLQRKQLDGSWDDSFVVRESNAAYGTEDDR